MAFNVKGNRAVVLGLDGLSWSLMERLIEMGVMPNLAALTREAQAGPMNSTWPEISPVAWTTFFTASSPGEHGIYGFTDFEPGGYDLRFNMSGNTGRPWIWDWLGLSGRRSVVLNVPMTYPAQALSGIMVSGFVALDYDRAAFPSWVTDVLRRNDYRLEADFERVHQDRDSFLADLDRALAGREMLFENFWSKDWDLFVLVVTDTDRLFHFFLREFLENGPVTGYFLDFFQRVDALVGRVYEKTSALAADGGDTALVLLSDHGFAPVREEFHLNRWLAGQGYLAEPGPNARALALDPTRIYINGPPRFQAGQIGPRDAGYLMMELADHLKKEPAVAGVMWGRDLYDGPRAQLGPDLVVRPSKGYEFKAKFTPGPIYTDSPLMGTHTYEDAFYLVRNFGTEAMDWNVESILDLGRYLSTFLGLSERLTPSNVG